MSQTAALPTPPASAPVVIDLTPTWGEIGVLMWRLVESKETTALAGMKPEFAKAMAMAQAITELRPSLTEEQQKVLARVLTAELTKQGF